MIIRINRKEKKITLDSGYSKETFSYNKEKTYVEGDMTFWCVNNVLIHIPNNYGVLIYE